MKPIPSIQFPHGLVALLLAFWVPVANAMLPGTMNFQAYVTDDTGAPIDGDQSVTFRLYTTASGGSMVWDEVQQLTINHGLVRAQLGAVMPLNLPDDFDTPLFLGIEIDTDGEMVPRQPVTLSGYAVQALNADTLDGQDAASLDQSAHLIDTRNPHNVTATQVGAIDIQALTSHAEDASVHHLPYRDPDAVQAILAADGAGSTLDADTVDGLDSSDLSPVIHTHTDYYTKAQVNAIVANMQAQITALQNLLQHFTRTGDNVYVTGANLHIRSGSGSTSGAVNGVGNLIVGYNEPHPDSVTKYCSLGEYSTVNDCTSNGGTWVSNHKTGSHNVIVGAEHNYSRYGGLVAGFRNRISGRNASVLGGFANNASNTFATVSGGWANSASGELSSISGGQFNTASGYSGSVSGGGHNSAVGIAAWVGSGEYNQAIGVGSSIAGGGGPNAPDGNLAVANYSAILGGFNNLAGDGNCALDTGLGRFTCSAGSDQSIGEQATVSGGSANVASGDKASVSGGTENAATVTFTSVTGGRSNVASGQGATISGGQNNTAEGAVGSVTGGQFNIVPPLATAGSVSGGFRNTASGVAATVSGGEQNEASGVSSAVSGGNFNKAEGTFALASGGRRNFATGNSSSVNGGALNSATGDASSINGGRGNIANGSYSSVSGGATNTARGWAASVSGGRSRTAADDNNWVAGSLFEPN